MASTTAPPSDLEPRLREVEISGARIDERLKTLATRDDVSSVKVWFVITAIALVVGVATVVSAIR
ncbi:MAG: hypothetical protein OXM56_02000 [Gammaproteobacteria bacterium]|nr:hypothetical protein [Gammaproteobacteria bacterium]